MRIHALLLGGGLVASLLLPSTKAHAFFWLFDQSARQAPVAQPYAGQTYSYQPGYGSQSYGQQANYGGQSYAAPSYGSTGSYSPIPRQLVDYPTSQPAGSIIVNTSERRLYLVLGGGKALRYGIGVGREGFQWSGIHHISRKQEWPDWSPPPQMLRRKPHLPRWMAGGPNNPLGARAMYIGSTLFRIHGSNEPWTIGRAVSSGCIRMANSDVIDLYSRVRIGTKVVVMR